MKGKLLTTLVLVAGGTLAMAADAPPAEGGMGGGFDPAAAFKAADKNSDGKLSMDEFSAMPTPNRGGGGGGGGGAGAEGMGGGAEGMGGGGPAASPADRFKALDTNSDGSISMEEFTAGMARRGGGGMGGGGMGGG